MEAREKFMLRNKNSSIQLSTVHVYYMGAHVCMPWDEGSVRKEGRIMERPRQQVTEEGLYPVSSGEECQDEVSLVK